jgi:uncharacterized RDD family membrane protein YckC
MAYAPAVIPPLPLPIGSRTTQYAGFWIRALAYTIDGFALNMLAAALASIHPNSSTITAMLTIAYLVPALLYFPFFWSSLGGSATPGMRLFRLRVVATDGSPISFARACVRGLGLCLGFLILYLGVFFVAFDPRKQGWHDKLAKTFVLRD